MLEIQQNEFCHIGGGDNLARPAASRDSREGFWVKLTWRALEVGIISAAWLLYKRGAAPKSKVE